MPRLVHKKPCKGCPHLRTAAPGWLGSASPAQFLEQTLCASDLEHAMPCHLAIDYEDPDWRETQYPDAPLCAGALQFMNNQMKQPYGDDLIDACDAVGTNDDVFKWPQEFMAHHGPDVEFMFLGNRVVVKQPDGTYAAEEDTRARS